MAQKEYVYIYDNTGTELHRLSQHHRVSRLDFLPFHFLLVSVVSPLSPGVGGAWSRPFPTCRGSGEHCVTMTSALVSSLWSTGPRLARVTASPTTLTMPLSTAGTAMVCVTVCVCVCISSLVPSPLPQAQSPSGAPTWQLLWLRCCATGAQ